MSKFSEDEIYSIHMELSCDENLKERFNKELLNTSTVPKYKHSDIIDKYRYALNEAKKSINH